jgi:hypothetical protein
MQQYPILAYVEPMKIGIPGILIGILLLLFGRKLFWFGIAVVGFYIGLSAADMLGVTGQGISGIIVGIIAGVAGVFLLYFLQKIALSIFGFCAGIYLTFILMHRLQFDVNWAWLLGGGLSGLIIASVFFHTALIIVTSLFGAYCIIREIPVASGYELPLFIVLVMIGMSVQNAMRKKQAANEKPEKPQKGEARLGAVPVSAAA